MIFVFLILNLIFHFKAQKCIFPFEFNSNSYMSCTQQGLNFNWCSPTEKFTGQALDCNPSSNYNQLK